MFGMERKISSLLFVLLCGCATIASEGKGDVDLPSANSGLFRPLKRGKRCDINDVCTGVDELPTGTGIGVPKYPSRPISRSPAVLARGTGGKDLRVVLYAARDIDTTAPTIVRMESANARDFTVEPIADVLKADQPFEGSSMSDPWAIEIGSEVVLYYSILAPATGPTAGQIPGIARARSTDGLVGRVFKKDSAPVFTKDGADAWETEPPRAPSLVLVGNEVHLFYASGASIGEAVSTDGGATFSRVKNNPVLKVHDPVDVASLPVGVKPPFDDLAVDDPCVDRAVTPAGRLITRMLYTGRDARGGATIGFAGRFGDSGTFDRHEGSVFGQKSHANAPAVARFPEFSLLYVNQDETQGIEVKVDPTKQLLGISISPASIKLPFDE